MNLYLVRHGQSVPNLENRHSGWTQLPLTAQGLADARRAGQQLRGISFDRIYSSDLRRAIQTAQTALPGCEPTQLPLLRERNVGVLTERYIPDCYAEYGDKYVQCRTTMDFTPFSGENAEHLRARAAEFLHLLESDPCENAVAFTHAGFISALLETVLDVRLDLARIRIPNACVIRFALSETRWQYIL